MNTTTTTLIATPPASALRATCTPTNRTLTPRSTKKLRPASLYTRHYDALFLVAWRLLGNTTDAEDVVQDVFLDLLADGPPRRPRGVGELRWLGQRVRHQCLAWISDRRHELLMPLDGRCRHLSSRGRREA
jgi:DNA-directed RNA polymerase specialized sigma24 family protein